MTTNKTKELEVKPLHKILLNISKHGDVLDEDEKDIYNYLKLVKETSRKELLEEVKKMIKDFDIEIYNSLNQLKVEDVWKEDLIKQLEKLGEK